MLNCRTRWDGDAALARTEGIAAALSAVLEGTDVPALAPGGWIALPAHRAGPGAADGAETVRNDLAAAEGIAVVRNSGPGGPGLTGDAAARLGAVRLGLVEAMLGQAVEHLRARTAGGRPLIEKQLVTGAMADVVAGIAEAAAGLDVIGPDTPADVVHEWHDRIGDLGWQVSMLFGARGYLADHPVRCLLVGDLVANLWLAGAED